MKYRSNTSNVARIQYKITLNINKTYQFIELGTSQRDRAPKHDTSTRAFFWIAKQETHRQKNYCSTKYIIFPKYSE